MQRDLRSLGLAALFMTSLAGGAHAQGPVPATCQGLKSGAEAALGSSSTAALAAVSYPGQADAPGCLITFTGTGAVYGKSFQAVAAKLDAMMQGRGWTSDPNAEADGPTGTALGYHKADQSVAVSVNYDTARGVCDADAPVASCHPTATQMKYTITLGLTPAS